MPSTPYMVVIERTATGYSAYAPDLPGCVAAGRTRAATLKLMKSAIEMHVAGMREDGVRPPRPSAQAAYVPAAAGKRLRRSA